MHLSGSRGGRAKCIFIFLFSFSLKAGDFAISTEPKPPLIFAGENKTVRLYLKNSANAARKIKLETRTYQVTTTTAAPLGERKKWKEISLEAGQTSVEKFPLTLPAIRATTTFVLKFYEEGNVVELGSVPLLVYPEDLLSKFKSSNKDFFVGVAR